MYVARPWAPFSVAILLMLGCGGDDTTKPSSAEPSVPDLGPTLAGCPDGFGALQGNLFYVDPQNGSDQGDGSQASPWRSIQLVIDEQVDCSDQDGNKLHEQAPVKGGDTIILVGEQGHDQELSISGCYNDDWVTITAAVLHEPRVTSVHFRGSAYWRIDGLTFLNASAGTMVRAEDHDTRGEAHHLEIYNNVLTSGDLQTVQDFVDSASTGVWLLHDPDHVTVKCNHFSKVGQAMTISGEYLDVLDNQVEFFSLDAIATGGHHNRFVGNHIYDSVKLGDGHHDDFFQSHMGANPDVSSDIQVAYNVFMNRYSSALPLDMQGPTQCLSAFEQGPKTNIRVFNNVCKTDHFHGITWADTHNSIFVNNTAVGGTELPGLPAGSQDWPEHTWISIEGSGNTIRNNLTVLNQSGGDHNLEIGADQVDQYFVDWAGLDLRLAAGSPAIDAGSAEGAPTDDVEGTPRDDLPDVGAYEHVAP